MNRFHVITDAAVIIRSKNGVYRQAKVYRRGEDLYAGYGSGFVRLMSNSGTSMPNVSWDEIDADCEITTSKLGRLMVKPQLAIAS